MDWYIYFAIGYGVGFISPIVIMLVYARKQIKTALKPFKDLKVK
jgi:uncharacterized protein YybS (DUF2232 family)